MQLSTEGIARKVLAEFNTSQLFRSEFDEWFDSRHDKPWYCPRFLFEWYRRKLNYCWISAKLHCPGEKVRFRRPGVIGPND